MVMAEVYYPDVISQPADDSASASFPRAPPPSPEMQPRGLCNIFEIPASKFDGIGLDLRRNSFSFDDDRTGEENDNYTARRKTHSCLFQDSDLYEEDDISCSPRKRVCCANNFLSPENHTTISSASCGGNSFTSSGFGSYGEANLEGGAVGGYQFKTSVHVGEGAQNIGRPLSSHLSPDSMLASKPQVIVPSVEEGVAVMRDPFSPSYYNEDHLESAMSRSFDLHATHPHLPLSFDTTQLPAVRPGRSHTLDTASLQKTLPPPPHLDGSSSSETNLDPSQRRRKISVKRKNPDESDNDPLQFSFDYSYSSTGSGENDWVLVDRQPEGVWPSEKKPCGGDHSSILSQSRLQPYVFNGESRPAPSLDVPSIPSFSNHKIRSDYASINASGNHPLQRNDMDTGVGFNLEDGEKMETDASTGSGPGIANLPLSNNSMAVSPSALLRPHPPPGDNLFGGSSGGGLLGIPSRHSCMEGFLHQQSRNGWWGTDNTEEQHMDTEVDIRLNFSKSL